MEKLKRKRKKILKKKDVIKKTDYDKFYRYLRKRLVSNFKVQKNIPVLKFQFTSLEIQ